MKTEHLKLYLSGGRDERATESIQNEIISTTKKSLESIQDPEKLFEQQEALKAEKERIQAYIKTMKSSNTKSNKQRTAMIAQWNSFVTGVTELSHKHGIDFKQFPSHLASGRTFVQMLQNIKPDTFVEVEGLRIPQQRTDALLDDKIIELFEVQVKSEILEEIIERKRKVMKKLFTDS